MDYLKITKVDGVTLHRRGQVFQGTLHLTTYHLIFTLTSNGGPATGLRELWVCYPMIERVELRKGSAMLYKTGEDNYTEPGDSVVPQIYLGGNLKLYCRDYNYLSFDFADLDQGTDVFESIMKLTCIDSIDKCYAFIYQPIQIENQFNSWNDFDPLKEFERQGLKFDSDEGELGSNMWRITGLNSEYSLCSTYPSVLCVPKSVSDTMLSHTVDFRSKRRFPTLVYYYKKNGCTLVRCSQPLVGLKQNRSPQDEKLIRECFATNDRADKSNLIVDARPVTNAMAQTALGAGTEAIENYGKGRKVFLSLENIHVMRDSINRVKEFLNNSDVDNSALDIEENYDGYEKLVKSGWIGHVSRILRSTEMLVKWIHLQGVHIVIHCSDGWDRTPQVCSLVQICIDPYFRTLDGFIVLVEKDWCSFGHQFNERCGHLQKDTKFYNYTTESNFQRIRQLNQAFKHQQSTKLESPVFQQFLDCVYQLLRQYPNEFEYNERFLRRLVYHLYSCQYGTFLQDNEHERKSLQLTEQTRSVWDYFKSRRDQFTNPDFKQASDEVLYPNYSDIIYWYQLYGRRYEEMNGQTTEARRRELQEEREERGVEKHVEEDSEGAEGADEAPAESVRDEPTDSVKDEPVRQVEQKLEALQIGDDE